MEIWKNIVGYENHYQISNLGNVKSCARYRISKGGVLAKMQEKIMKLKTTPSGYLIVGLRLNNQHKMHSVHRLVALHFVENPDNKPTVNHIDGNKINNCAENLEWSTIQEQTIHAIETGLIKPRGNTKYSPQFKKQVYEYYINNCCSIAELVRVFNISQKTASLISKGNFERNCIKLKEEDIPNIKFDRENGMTLESIAKKYNCGISQIHRIVNNKSRNITYER